MVPSIVVNADSGHGVALAEPLLVGSTYSSTLTAGQCFTWNIFSAVARFWGEKSLIVAESLKNTVGEMTVAKLAKLAELDVGRREASVLKQGVKRAILAVWGRSGRRFGRFGAALAEFTDGFFPKEISGENQLVGFSFASEVSLLSMVSGNRLPMAIVFDVRFPYETITPAARDTFFADHPAIAAFTQDMPVWVTIGMEFENPNPFFNV